MPEVTVATPAVSEVARNATASPKVARVRNAHATVSAFLDTANNVTDNAGAHPGYELKAGVEDDFRLDVGEALYGVAASATVRLDVVVS